VNIFHIPGKPNLLLNNINSKIKWKKKTLFADIFGDVNRKKIYTCMALLFQLKMEQYIIVDQKAVTYKIF